MRDTSAESSSPRGSGEAISETTLLSALHRVLDVDADPHPAAATMGPDDVLEDLGVDSMVLAELIVQIEEDLSVLLEFRPQGRLTTVADLGHAIRIVGVPPASDA